MENQSTDEIQIDIFRAIVSVLRKWPFIVVVMCIAGYAGYSYFNDKIFPTYSCSGKIYIIDKESQEINVSIEDLDIGSRLVEDYKNLVTSRIVLEKVIEELELDITYESLKENISIDNPDDTRIIGITLTYDDDERIQKILNRIEDVTCYYLSNKLGTERPTILERACCPTASYESSVLKNVAICMMAAAVLMAGAIGFLDIINMRIRYEKEVVRHLELDVIGNIPDVSKHTLFRFKK